MKYLPALLICFCLLWSSSYAQDCNGSLGDPIVKVDFGNSKAALTEAEYQSYTTYKPTNNSPGDGQFHIAQRTAEDVHKGTWFQTADHTGDDGYMMIVNASYEPGEFFRKDVKGLCPGTTYQFSAFIFNLLKGIGRMPNITFTIQSAVDKVSINTGDLANGDSLWHQYSVYFLTPPGSGDVTLIMSNNAPGGNGNDIALDDIAFQACGPSIGSGFAGSNNILATGCEGDDLSYDMTANPAIGYRNVAYQWQVNTKGIWENVPGATSIAFKARLQSARPGTYQYRIVAAEAENIDLFSCRVSSNILTVTVNPLPVVKISGASVVCEGKSTVILASPADSYSWTGPNGFKSAEGLLTLPPVTMASAGVYHVVMKIKDCSASGDFTLNVTPRVVPVISKNVTICLAGTAQLQASGGSTYLWYPGTGLSDPNIANPIASPTETTTYNVRITGPNGCFETASVTVTVAQYPTANAGNDMVVFEGQPIKLNGTATGAKSYWTPNTFLQNDTDLHAVANPTEDITYTLHTTTGDPCNFEATDQVYIRVYQKVVPTNTFTPNNDGVNDTWKIKALDTYPGATTQVFSRQGALVYQTQGYSKPWDGTMNGKYLPAAVYYYKIDLKNGQVLSGWVSIVR